MKKPHRQPLFIAAVLMSLGLTGLTVWAVAEQGRALRERQWGDLVNDAKAVVTERTARARADADRALDGAVFAWSAGGEENLDAWVARQPVWDVAVSEAIDGSRIVYPRTPLRSDAAAPALPGGTPDGVSDEERLASLRRLAGQADPIVRVGALLTAAAFEQQLGHPHAAAQLLAEAAQFMRTNPGLSRLAFRTELRRVEALLDAGELNEASDSLLQMLRAYVDDRPTRLSEVEVARLDQLARTLRLANDHPAHALLEELRARARRRSMLLKALLQHLNRALTSALSDDVPWRVRAEEHHIVLVESRSVGTEVRIAVATDAATLLAHYWQDVPADASWRVAPAGSTKGRTLIDLGEAFAYARLIAAPAAEESLNAMHRRQIGLVTATATGTLGGWALVLWMLARAIRRQHELVKLQRRFVADVSHELKTPLALIRLLSETLAVQRVRDPERAKSYLETITRESERLSVLLDSILDFSRIESGRKTYELAECDVAAVARQAWTLFEPQLTQDGFEHHLNIASDLPHIRADAQALQQVIVNLLQNAHRYSREQRYIALTVRREGFLILIQVEDHGIGMTRNELQRLGDSFFRGEDSYVRQSRGAGLGLTIVNHIVQAHSGKLEVRSQPGRGSTFTVWIPFEPPTAAAQE